MHSDFLGNPLPTPCIIHEYEVIKNIKTTDTLLQTLPFEKTEECDNKKINMEVVLLLQTDQSLAGRIQDQDSRQPTLPG